MPEQRNLILAIILSTVVLFGWQYFFGMPQMQQERARQADIAKQEAAPKQAIPVQVPRNLPRAQALAQAPRSPIQTPTLDGSINLAGGRLDDLRLRLYRETLNPNSREIELFSPNGSEQPYFAEFGWLPAQGSTFQAPGETSQWRRIEGDTLAPDRPVTLQYDAGQGVTFTRRIAVDDRYMFTVTDKVENTGAAPIVVTPYALVSRRNLPNVTRNWVVHEGFIGVANGVLQDPSYKNLADDNETRTMPSTGGWLGITDKYWMAALIPQQQEKLTGRFQAHDEAGTKAYQADYMLAPRTVAPGASQEVTHHLFAGAKVVNIIEDYRNRLGIPLFDYAVDWGWFWFLTKPIFTALEYLYHYVGNFGVSILIFTVFVKLVFFPLASTSYRAMSKMKKLQPEMERLRERLKDDRVAQQQSLMELYRKEKVNPAAGCLPMVIQIPVFFSLYKVLFVSIEMRHAPFIGWIQDLSAPDPTSIFNLFGLLPFTPPGFLMIGVLPLIMGFTMWLQTNLNPPPADPAQAKIFGLMPILFTFMLANFPAGLVIYWTWNNLLSIAQQIYIMKRSGTPVDVFDRLRGMGKRLRRGGPLEKPAGPPD
jgi:YidC/Oxa1 family membrane protein insertase